MRKYMLHWVAFILIFIVVYGTTQNPWSTRYIHNLKQDDSMSVAKTKDPLQEKIEKAARHCNKPAINAENNRVWKAIPGYNGIRVDEKSSYEKMKKGGAYDPDKLVVKQVPPDVHLNDLAPAPVYKGNPEKPVVSLMVNVAWGNSYLKKILKIMDEEHVHATFFLDGTWAKKNPDLAKRIQQDGHEIGNHAYSHPDLKQLSSDQIRTQIKKTQDVVASITNTRPKLFAPPSGSYNQQTVKVADQQNMNTILWTLDTIDWKSPDPRTMSERIVQNVKAGTLVLMHPTKATSEGLKQIIKGIRARGYHIRTVSDLLSEKRL